MLLVGPLQELVEVLPKRVYKGVMRCDSFVDFGATYVVLHRLLLCLASPPTSFFFTYFFPYLLVYGQVSIIFVVSVCLCRVFLSRL